MMIGVLSLLVAGCGEGGPALVEIEGTVTHNGSPLADADLTIVFNDGLTSTGRTGADGKFTTMTNGRPGSPLGTGKVTITKQKVAGVAGGSGPMKPEDMAKMAAASMAGGPGAMPKSEIPEKYMNPTTSGLTIEVVAGGKSKNNFTLALTD